MILLKLTKALLLVSLKKNVYIHFVYCFRNKTKKPLNERRATRVTLDFFLTKSFIFWECFRKKSLGMWEWFLSCFPGRLPSSSSPRWNLSCFGQRGSPIIGWLLDGGYPMDSRYFPNDITLRSVTGLDANAHLVSIAFSQQHFCKGSRLLKAKKSKQVYELLKTTLWALNSRVHAGSVMKNNHYCCVLFWDVIPSDIAGMQFVSPLPI